MSGPAFRGACARIRGPHIQGKWRSRSADLTPRVGRGITRPEGRQRRRRSFGETRGDPTRGVARSSARPELSRSAAHRREGGLSIYKCRRERRRLLSGRVLRDLRVRQGSTPTQGAKPTIGRVRFTRARCAKRSRPTAVGEADKSYDSIHRLCDRNCIFADFLKRRGHVDDSGCATARAFRDSALGGCSFGLRL